MILSVILVNYKQPDQTIDCVRSLDRSTFQDFQTIIVDNESDLASEEKLRGHCPNAVVIPVAQNLGFAGANNIGIRFAIESGSKLVLLLNNDTVVHKELLEELVETAEEDKSTGVVGGKIFYFDKPDTLWFAGGRLNIHKALGTHEGIGIKDDGSFNLMKESDYMTGCCLLTKREVVEKIGLLDTRFFLYLEDADFCVRAKDAGYNIIYQPKAIVYHKVSSSTQWDSPVYIYFSLRNKILFLRKHSSFSLWARYSPYLMYFYLRQFARLIFKWHNFRAARAAFLGMLDGLRNSTGRDGEGSLHRL